MGDAAVFLIFLIPALLCITATLIVVAGGRR